jgi:hypothetical protein
MPLYCWNLLLCWKAIIFITWFAIIFKLLLLLIILFYSYLVFDDGSAKPALSFLIPLNPWCCSIVGIFSFLESNYFDNWLLFYFNNSHTPTDYYVYTLYLMMAIQSRLFSSRYLLTQNAVGLLESSPLLKGNYFNNWFLYYFNINYSPLDYNIHSLYLMMAMQGRMLTSWYPLTPDAVRLLESSPLLKGNYFNNWFLYYFNINYSPIDYNIYTLYLMMAMQGRLFPS